MFSDLIIFMCVSSSPNDRTTTTKRAGTPKSFRSRDVSVYLRDAFDGSFLNQNTFLSVLLLIKRWRQQLSGWRS